MVLFNKKNNNSVMHAINMRTLYYCVNSYIYNRNGT